MTREREREKMEGRYEQDPKRKKKKKNKQTKYVENNWKEFGGKQKTKNVNIVILLLLPVRKKQMYSVRIFQSGAVVASL